MTFLVASFLLSAAQIQNIEELSLDDLLDPTLETAMKSELKLSETPGIVTSISREEIEASGAQYLMDLLQLVPGFQFGVDVLGVVGVGFRGLWGQEGKVLVLVDGMELNDTLYGTMPFGQHIPLGIAERVEIIRGPGSATYGGFAGLAVINVITKSAKTLRGASATGYFGQWQRAPGRGTMSLSAGNAWGELELSLNAAVGFGRMSDAIYQDSSGNFLDLRDATNTSNTMLNFALRYRGLRVRVLNDEYTLDTQTGYGQVQPLISSQRFGTWISDVRYDIQAARSFRLTPQLSFKYQQPWQVTDPSALYFNRTATRLRGGVVGNWTVTDGLDVTMGLEGYWDHATITTAPGADPDLSYGGKASVSYGNGIAYAQLVWLNKWVNVTGGVRGEYHSQFGPSFVPRLALTRAIDRFNFKVLYSQAFRQPAIENLALNPSLLPERTNVVEAEVSVRLTPTQQISVNGFFGRIDRAIVYGVLPDGGNEIYHNAGHTGSSGVEAEYQLKETWAHIRFNYSFYSANLQNTVQDYAVANDPSKLLGMATHKFALLASFDLWRGHIWLDTSGTFLSARRGASSSLPETLLVNTALRLRNLPVHGLEMALGVADITNQRYAVLQPYTGGHGALPLQGREFYIRARIDADVF